MADPTLAAARTALAAELGALDYVPEVIDPPCVVIEPGDPYLTYDGVQNFGRDTFVAALSVYVLVPADDNEAMARALDSGLLAAINAIEEAGWVLTRVGRPDTFTTAEWQAYGVQITVNARVTRG